MSKSKRPRRLDYGARSENDEAKFQRYFSEFESEKPEPEQAQPRKCNKKVGDMTPDGSVVAEIRICLIPDCGDAFWISSGSIAWHQEHGYPAPRRCPACRREARERGEPSRRFTRREIDEQRGSS